MLSPFIESIFNLCVVGEIIRDQKKIARNQSSQRAEVVARQEPEKSGRNKEGVSAARSSQAENRNQPNHLEERASCASVCE